MDLNMISIWYGGIIYVYINILDDILHTWYMSRIFSWMFSWILRPLRLTVRSGWVEAARSFGTWGSGCRRLATTRNFQGPSAQSFKSWGPMKQNFDISVVFQDVSSLEVIENYPRFWKPCVSDGFVAGTFCKKKLVLIRFDTFWVLIIKYTGFPLHSQIKSMRNASRCGQFRSLKY